MTAVVCVLCVFSALVSLCCLCVTGYCVMQTVRPEKKQNPVTPEEKQERDQRRAAYNAQIQNLMRYNGGDDK